MRFDHSTSSATETLPVGNSRFWIDSDASTRTRSSSRLRLAIFVSEETKNLDAVAQAIDDGLLNAEIVAIVGNRRRSDVFRKYDRSGIPLLYRPYFSHQQTRAVYDRKLAEDLLPFRPDLLVLTWWMHIFTPCFLDRFPGQVINIHPALPGQFPGAMCTEESHEAIVQGAIRNSGVMLHYAVPEVDAGPVIRTRVVRGNPHEDLESFESRLVTAECEVLIESLKELAAKMTAQKRSPRPVYRPKSQQGSC